MNNNEPFDPAKAILRKHQNEDASNSFMAFHALVSGIANRLIVRRRKHLWGLVPDDSYGSFVADIYVGGDKPSRLRIWQIHNLDNLYVDNTKRLVERTASGAFRRVEFNDFTPERRLQIMNAFQVLIRFKII